MINIQELLIDLTTYNKKEIIVCIDNEYTEEAWSLGICVMNRVTTIVLLCTCIVNNSTIDKQVERQEALYKIYNHYKDCKIYEEV